jgi:hypothetical protein
LGQLEPNEFEEAILKRIAQDVPAIGPLIDKLRVLSREFTGVGSYTNFDCPESVVALGKQAIGLNALIIMPNVPGGMGAVLFCEDGKPKCLETYTFGKEQWDGNCKGFSFE